MKVVFYLLCILILTLFQVGVLPAVFGGYPHFNLFLCLVAAFAFRGYFSESLWLAFLGGISLDFFTFLPFGLTSLVLVLFSCFCRRVGRVLGLRWLVFAASCLIFSSLLRFVSSSFSLSWFCLWGAGEDALLAGLFYLFFVPIWEKVFGRCERQLSFEGL